MRLWRFCPNRLHCHRALGLPGLLESAYRHVYLMNSEDAATKLKLKWLVFGVDHQLECVVAA